MRRSIVLVGLVVAAAACTSDATAPTVETTAITLPDTTTTIEPPAATTTTSRAAPASTTTTSLVVPEAECAVDLPETVGSDVQDVEIAVFSNEGNPVPMWALSLGDRPVEMDTLGDRIYLATADGFVASFDLDPCGLDWLTNVGPGVTDVIAGAAGIFVVSDTSLTVLEPIEGLPTSFALGRGRHQVVAGPDVLAVSDGESVLLYDYLTRQSSSLPVAGAVDGLAGSDTGVVLSRAITVEFRTWLGLPVWERDMPERVEAVAAAGSSVMVRLSGGSLVALDAGTGDVRWEQLFEAGSTLAIGPIDHEELHVLEFASVARHHHFAVTDGSPVFVSESPVWQTFAEYDDELILVVDEGAVTARDLLEQEQWTITTGADGVGRFTEVDVTDDFIAALSFSAERF